MHELCISLMFEIIVVYLKLASGEHENENNRENASAMHFHDSKLAKPYVLKGQYVFHCLNSEK